MTTQQSLPGMPTSWRQWTDRHAEKLISEGQPARAPELAADAFKWMPNFLAQSCVETAIQTQMRLFLSRNHPLAVTDEKGRKERSYASKNTDGGRDYTPYSQMELFDVVAAGREQVARQNALASSTTKMFEGWCLAHPESGLTASDLWTMIEVPLGEEA